MTPAQEEPSVPVGEDERETAVRRLREAYAEEHISHEDMDTRLGQALAATTQGELAVALDALPGRKPDTTATIAAAGGRIRRRGVWRVPRVLKVESAFGRVRLDLSRAVIEYPVVDVELHLGTGGARITVPRDATVEMEGLRTGWKDVQYTPPRRPRTGGPTIRISGEIGFGRLRIRHAGR